ncbi:cytochrome P450 [Fusarium albosuccineum]|uniref:Cytochrome P450 n=1 Tax=Fusarium albosuccineum TaxID=1237068 RepID=A0A8H4L4A9_9HYPO|nr:cytochrome P450 [Fusarium albosuccineum]
MLKRASLQAPQHVDRLRREIDRILEPDEVIAPYDKVKDLPFLRACIDESLRIIPPTSTRLPRRTPAEGTQILDKGIVGDISVNMTIYAAHRDLKIFPDPETSAVSSRYLCSYSITSCVICNSGHSTNIDTVSLSVTVAFAVGGLLGDTLFYLPPQSFVSEDYDEAVKFVLIEPNRDRLLGLGIGKVYEFFAIDKGLRTGTGGEGYDHSYGHGD